ncbi:MAG TPA: TolC family outer membrane protein, partial [Novosphingobium sp.]
ALADAAGPAVVEPPQGATESLRDAIVASLKQNPEIQIALAQQDDARFGVDEARAGYLPHIDIQAGYGREMAKSGSSPKTQAWRGEASITLNQNLWDFGVTINDIKRARATYSSAQWATRERIEAISYDITNAYLGVLTQQQLLALTEEEIAATTKILRIVTVQKDLGLTTPADVGRAQTRLENVQSQLLDRKSALQQARNAYKRLTDHLPARVIDLPPGGTTLPESADAAVGMMADHSPKLAQAVQDRRSLEKQYDSQTGTYFPRIGLMVQGNYKNDVMGLTGRADDARAMVTLSYRLLNGGADRAVRRRIGARLREADYEVDRRRREVEQDIRIDYESLGAARQKIATIEAEIESAQRVADLYRQQFREGRRTVFELLDSQQQLFAARANQITNAIAMRAAEYRVLQKLGGLFDLVSGGEALPPLVVPAPGSDD